MLPFFSLLCVGLSVCRLFLPSLSSTRRDVGLAYDEPWGWMVPAEHALGALLLEHGHVEEATSVFR